MCGSSRRRLQILFLEPSLRKQRSATLSPRTSRRRGVPPRLRRRQLLRRQHIPSIRTLRHQSRSSPFSLLLPNLTENRKKSSPKTSASPSQPGTISHRANYSSSPAQKPPPTSPPRTSSVPQVLCPQHNPTPSTSRKKPTTTRRTAEQSRSSIRRSFR